MVRRWWPDHSWTWWGLWGLPGKELSATHWTEAPPSSLDHLSALPLHGEMLKLMVSVRNRLFFSTDFSEANSSMYGKGWMKASITFPNPSAFWAQGSCLWIDHPVDSALAGLIEMSFRMVFSSSSENLAAQIQFQQHCLLADLHLLHYSQSHSVYWLDGNEGRRVGRRKK